jgi:hypothetical protein
MNPTWGPEIASALTLCFAEMQTRVKPNKRNPHLGNRYADLGSVIDTAKPILVKYGLALIQVPISDTEGKVGIKNLVIHGATGQFFEQFITMDNTPHKGINRSQATGVIISYLRRYSWAAIFGIYADEDYDGETGTASPEQVAAKAEKKAEPAPKKKAEPAPEFYRDDVVNALVPKYAQNYHNALAMAKLCKMPFTATTTMMESWGRYYREVREDTSAADAARHANQKYDDAVKERK